MNKEIKFLGITLILVIILFIGFLIGKSLNTNNKLAFLPLPEVTGGQRGELGIDKHINEKSLDKYLNRSDSVYRDMRMLEDPGYFEAIGGDSKLSGFVKGFEVVPLPYIIPIDDLPSSVGKTYEGKTLFSLDENGNYVSNYEESMDIIEYLFPKDKVIFLMCGGGGYAGKTKEFLVKMGWDEDKIYNTGGYWYYEGKNNVKVKVKRNGQEEYDYWKVNYHDLNFDSLHEVSHEE